MEEERMRLKKLYAEMPEEQLIEIILEDEREYKREPYEAYELLLEEAKRRGLEEKINERRNSIVNKDIKPKDIELVVVKTFQYRHEAGFAQGLLAEEGIKSILSADDVGGMRPEIAFARGAVWLLVKKENLQRAKETLGVLEETTEK